MGSQMNANFSVAAAGVTGTAQGALKNAKDARNERLKQQATGGRNLRQQHAQEPKKKNLGGL